MNLKLENCKKFANNMGGECLSQSYNTIRTPMDWICKNGHTFTKTFRAVKENFCIECKIDERRMLRSLIKCMECDKYFKRQRNLNQHIRTVHGSERFPCTVCDHSFTQITNLNRHMLIHDGIRNFQCNRCENSFTTKQSLENHINIIHEKKREYVCKFCEKNFSTSYNLVHHITSVHENQKNYTCLHCDKLFSSTSSVKIHIKTIHENRRDYECTECHETFTQSNTLATHLERVHDIGKYECEFCYQNKNSQIEYTDIHGTHNICKACYNSLIDKPIRCELKISAFLDEIPDIYPFLIGSNKSFRTMGGCSRKRPDKIYSSGDIVLWIEVDEHQHYMSNGDYTCEEKRISDGFDEFVDGQKLVVIRFNPNGYTPPTGISKKSLSERLNLLREIILQVLQNPPLEIIYVYYLFYNESNPHITKHIPNKLIF